MEDTSRLRRDALTGALFSLDDDVVLFRLRTDRDPRAEPRVIDRREPYHADGALAHQRNYAGGFEWSADFERYIRDALPRSIAYAKLVWREWWRLPVVVERLPVHLGHDGAAKLQAALMFHRDGLPVDVIARRLDHTFGWVRRAEVAAVRIVRSRYLPYAERSRYLAELAAALDESKDRPTTA